MKRSVLVQILAAIAGPALLVGAVFCATSNLLARNVKASAYNIVFDSNNSPTLDASGNAEITDHRGIVYEYHNAQDLNNGHIALKHNGYFGISSSSPYGVKGIESIVPHFTCAGSGELWLLKSIDGTTWEEYKPLTDNETCKGANDWQYVRFHNYATDGSVIDVSSITINYSCQSINASEDADLSNNLVRHDDTDDSIEYKNSNDSIVSPREGSTQALRLTCTNQRNTVNHYTIFGLGIEEPTTLGELKYSKFEFDYYYQEKRDPKKAPGYPKVMLANGTTTIGTSQTIGSNVGNTYTYEEILDASNNKTGWWHMECYITAIFQLAEYDESTAIDGITIYDDAIYEHDLPGGVVKTGFIVVDNVRLINHTHDAKLSNRTVDVPASGSDTYFLRENICGTLIEATYESSDPSVATIIRKKNNKGRWLNYVHGITDGKVTITITYTLGYNRSAVEIQTAELTVGQPAS